MTLSLRIVALLLALVPALIFAGDAGAAVGPNGYLTLSNTETGVDIAVECRGNFAERIFHINERNVVKTTGVPLGTFCTPDSIAVMMPGFAPVINIDPSEGWVVEYSFAEAAGTSGVSTCGSRGQKLTISVLPNGNTSFHRYPSDECSPFPSLGA